MLGHKYACIKLLVYIHATLGSGMFNGVTSKFAQGMAIDEIT